MSIRKLFIKILGLAFFLAAVFLFTGSVSATTNISSSTEKHWAWNDIIGWIDFFNTDTITVSSNNLTGYASSSAGEISLDCATTSGGNICGTSNYQVTNDGLGNLSNWGWNDEYGWISFDCNNHTTSTCSQNYQVWIDPNNGQFQNYAWNDIIGWISFNCVAPGPGCSTQYRVETSWVATSTSGYVDSTTYDTGVSGGAQLNSVIWYGDKPAGTAVRFQFATSNSSSGPWNYMGTDGTSDTFYNTTGPASSLKLDFTLHNDKRYFRYRVTLVSDQAQNITPRVDDVVINWSP